MKEQNLHTALENFSKHTGIEAFYIANPNSGSDGEVDFIFQNGKEKFAVEVRKQIRYHQLEAIKHKAALNKKFLLIAEIISPQIKESLRKEHIFYLDKAGNIFLQTPNHYFWIEGHKLETTPAEKTNRAFTASGLKVIYLFLTDEQWINKPQRLIAEKTGVALGNINNIISSLKEQKFLLQKNKKEMMLVNKQVLIGKWVNDFDEKLKPTLHIGNFRFLINEFHHQWKMLPLQKQQTFWGGEPAGALITNFLLPEIYTIYTEEARNNLIKNYRLIPDTNGNIKIYKKFWADGNTFNETIVHPLLVYTDLLNTNDTRCIETAQKIYDELLYHRFQ